MCWSDRRVLSVRDLSHLSARLNATGNHSCLSLSPGESDETSKENLRLSVTPKERTSKPLGFLAKDYRGRQRPPMASWYETPKRDSSLRHRLLMCRPNQAVKPDKTRETESSTGASSEHWLSVSFDSFDAVTGALASSTLNPDQEQPLSGRERRLLFTQVRTSTLEDGKLDSGQLSSCGRRISLSDADFIENMSASDQIHIETPTFSKFLSVCEDSGFGSLALDKSQDDSVDYDGSFQELLLSASKGNSETPNLAETKRRSRLQRQHRLSTLKEGGSQSEEHPADRKHLHQGLSQSTDDVFADVTPRGAAKLTPGDLSLTPALQLVHAMCQQKAQMFVGQSPSLKDQLKFTAALTETPSTIRTSMPLAGLIGRKMGLGKLDILSELMKGNFRHILAVIFSHLNSESIYRCGQVSRSWSEIIQQDKRARLKRRSHLREVEAAIQLGGAVHVPDAETRLTLLKRSPLKTVQAQSRTSIPVVLFFFSFQVAKTLSNDECLKPCPRCQHPARCHSVKGEGVCTRADCGFQFCTACLCAFHSSRECGSQSVGRRKKDVLLPGSAQSKRNIRRL
uniref:ZBR-type domain-containing protein n=1 Tax=Mola mola TaxID=94237 RepID=A0A3Q3XDL2_MOLML